jgi:phenylalanyl-tRNA synthetase beta chain
MFGIGQPTHIFDANKLANSNGIKIGVRVSTKGEKITALGGEEYELSDNIAVITDANIDTPIAIAGVKGGVVAEVDDDTVDIVVESAKFHPIKTRRASAALKLRTDAVQRFENEVPIELPPYGVYEVARLITEVAGGTVEGYVDSDSVETESHKVTISMSGLNSFLGSEISINEAIDIIKRFGWEYEVDGDELTVVPPFERLDVRIVEDVYEEIGRVYGWSNIESKSLPQPGPEKFINKEMAYSELMRKAMLEAGITETTTYTLRDKGDIKLASVLSSDKDHVRANLHDGISDALDKAIRDAPLLGEYEMIKIYEIGRVFTKDGEHTSAAIGVRALGKKNVEQRQDAILTDLQSLLEQELGGELKGVDIKDGILEFNLTQTYADLPTPSEYPRLPLIASGLTYTQMSQYPFIIRDIAVWVPEDASESEIIEVIEQYSGKLVQRIDKFDEFVKDSKVSLAFHIIFQAMDRTLRDDEINNIMQKVENTLNTIDGFEVR